MGKGMSRASRRRRRRDRPGRRPADDAVWRRDGRGAGAERDDLERQERGAGDQAAQARQGESQPALQFRAAAGEGAQGVPRLMRTLYDLLIKNVRIVRPTGNVVHPGDIAIRAGKFVKVGGNIPAREARATYDGKDRKSVV